MMPGTIYNIGDKVRVKAGKDHGGMGVDDIGVIKIISTPALGVKFPSMDMIHKWYTDDEVEPADDSRGKRLKDRTGAILYRSHPTHILSTRKHDDRSGVVEAIVSPYDIIDSWGTRFVMGAFADYDRANSPNPNDMPRVCWAHDWNRFVGKVTESAELKPGDKTLPEGCRKNGGWWVQSEFALRTRDGLDLFEHLDFGSVNKWSHGFEPIDQRIANDGIQEFTRVICYEVSPVLVPANSDATTLGTRGYEAMTLKDKIASLDNAMHSLERHLRSYADMRSNGKRDVDGELRRDLHALAGAVERADAILTTVSIRGEQQRMRAARTLLKEASFELNKKGIYHD